MHALVVDLGPGPSAEDLLRRADGLPGLVCLRGRFVGGSPVLTSHPIRAIRRRPSTEELAPLLEGGGGAPDDGFVGGGWFGVLGYDDAATRFAFHDHVVRLLDGRWRFEALWTPARGSELDRRRQAWAALLAGSTPRGTWSIGEFSGADEMKHLAAVEDAVALIRAGEIYQVNICTRFRAPFDGSAAALFATAAERLDPAYGMYLDGRICCLSPELFLRRRGRELTSAPIKGTRAVGPGSVAALRGSDKDVAENVMIVDLVRNDLGRVCEIGTVGTPELLRVSERVGVVHLVSEVAGTVQAAATDLDVLDATFPPGSVTGAPKIRAQAVIAESESARRGAFTGAVGFLSPAWGMEFAVVIRTFELVEGHLELGVGGGITADSVPTLEWQECLDKAAPLFAASTPTAVPGPSTTPIPSSTPGPSTTPTPPFGDQQRRSVAQPREPAVDHEWLPDATDGVFETLLVLDGGPVRAPDHLARLSRSVRELYGGGLPEETSEQVRRAAAGAPTGRAVLRVTVGPDVQPRVTLSTAPAPRGSCDATSLPRAAANWRHKWADRRWADAAERRTGAAVPLLVAADGTVLETSRGNVFLLDDDGGLVTPPLRDDLLPGVTRSALLDLARGRGIPTQLRCFGLDELRAHPAFWTSSLSGAVAIHRVDGWALPRADDVVSGFSHELMHSP